MKNPCFYRTKLDIEEIDSPVFIIVVVREPISGHETRSDCYTRELVLSRKKDKEMANNQTPTNLNENICKSTINNGFRGNICAKMAIELCEIE